MAGVMGKREGGPSIRRLLLTVAALMLLWQLTSVLLGTSPTNYKYIPGIPDVLGAYKALAGYWHGGLGAEATNTGAEPTYWGATLGLVYNSVVTGLRAMVGLALALVVSIGLALLISWSRLAREVLSFPAHLIRMAPVLGMVPLFALWFGSSEVGTVLYVAFVLGSFLFVVAMNGIANVPHYYYQYARSLGASPVRSYLTVVFPAAVTGIRGGVVLAVTWSWAAVLAAEFLGKDVGLGHILSFARTYAATDLIALIGVIVVLLGTGSYLLANKIFSTLTRWAE